MDSLLVTCQTSFSDLDAGFRNLGDGVNVGVAMGVPRSKAVQALSELLCHHELERETDRDAMEVRIVMGKEERP